MPCFTGFDNNGCEMPQTCVPINGNFDVMEEKLYQILKTTNLFSTQAQVQQVLMELIAQFISIHM